MKRETPNAKRRAVSISPSSKNHMTATIRRGFALLIENGLTQGAIGRISYKIEVEGGAYKGVTARRESNDYGVMETKIDKYEFTASFVGEEAKGVEVAAAEDAAAVSDEQVAEKDTLTVENAYTAYTVEDKAHPEYGFKRFNCQDQPMNDGKKPLSSIGTGSNSKVISESEYHLYRIVTTRDDAGLEDNRPDNADAIEESASTGETSKESTPDYTDKEILITMHCYDKGHKVARLVSMSMFSIPDYDAADGLECNVITEDEIKRVELIKQWIVERANDQHESILEFVKYEIVEAGTLSELDLNRQLKLEAEKHDCEERAVKVGDVVSSRTNVNSQGLRVETIETVKHVFDNDLQLKEYFEQDCIMERSMNDAFKHFYNFKLDFHCPLWHRIGGEKLWLSYNDKSKVYLITSCSDEINKDDVMNREKEFRKFSLIARELGAKAFKEGERCKSDLDDDFNAMLDQVKFKGFNLSDHYFFGWSDERVAFEVRKKESLAADDTRKKNDEPKEVNAEVADEAVLDIQEDEEAEANPVDSSESEAKKLAIAAEIIGYQAFKDGKKCVPALDRNLDSLLENLPAGTSLAIMIYERWARGWMDANLSAPVVYEEEAPAAEAAQVESKEPEADGRQSARNIVAALKESDQDFEYYPTTQEMLDCIYRDMRRGTDKDESFSVLEVGAGTASAGKFLADGGKVLAIEKSEILRNSWPCDVIPVGTDFDNLSVIGIKAKVCFCNPPYSAYEAWAARIISEFSGGRIYLVIPQRWSNSDLIKLAIKDRKASSKVIFSGDFLEAERSARAKVDIVCVDLRQDEWGSRRFTKVDPFFLWYEKEFKQKPELAQDEQKINIDIDESSQVVSGESYIERISSLYSAELKTLQEAFQSINGLSGKVFKLLNLSRGSLCEALETEINGIRAKYWNELFKKYKPIASRLTSHGLKRLRGQFSAQESIDFTVENILAATVWAIKYANEMNNEQLEVFVLQLFDKANIVNYKSNQRTFEKEDWRYSRHEKAKSYSHYGLDYRIVLENVMPFPYREGFSFSYDYPNGLSKRCHDLVNDLLVISRNLGYESDGVTSYHHDWNPGNKKNFYLKNGDTAFTVKGYIKGTMHFQINQDIMRAMNVEFGRLKGWIKSKKQAAEELGISEGEADKAWGSLTSLMPPVPSLMLGM